jgi:dihydrodipicolinate synthase/N-acetylneuraminate lyase
MPREAVQLYELVAAGDHTAALELWTRMIPSLLLIWHGDYNPAIKSACRIRGFDGGGVRRPLRPLSAESEKELKASLALLDS